MIDIAATVKQVVDAVGAGTVGRDRLRARVGHALLRVAAAPGVRAGEIGRSRRQQHERGGVASIEREFHQLLLADDGTERAGTGFDHFGAGLHCDGVAGGAKLEDNGHGGVTVRSHGDAALLEELEAGCLDGDRITAGG